jgi:hypothetical protein
MPLPPLPPHYSIYLAPYSAPLCSAHSNRSAPGLASSSRHSARFWWGAVGEVGESPVERGQCVSEEVDPLVGVRALVNAEKYSPTNLF